MNTTASRTVKLNSGYEMPALGLGTWTLTGATAENAVYAALKSGYRLIDTAKYYGNESEVGNAIRRAAKGKKSLLPQNLFRGPARLKTTSTILCKNSVFHTSTSVFCTSTAQLLATMQFIVRCARL